jgi:hypothetical protein
MRRTVRLSGCCAPHNETHHGPADARPVRQRQQAMGTRDRRADQAAVSAFTSCGHAAGATSGRRPLPDASRNGVA